MWTTSTKVIFPGVDKAALQEEVAALDKRLEEAQSRCDTLVQLMNGSPR